jgi:hypothetical protein
MILLNRSYAGYPAGSIVQMQTVVEAALIAQGLASSSAGPVTAGNISTTQTQGRVGGAAATASLTVSNPSFTTESKFNAYLSQAAADATATVVNRIVAAAGSVTFFLNAASTGVISIDWMMEINSGDLALS